MLETWPLTVRSLTTSDAGDLFVAAAFGEQAQDFALAVGQLRAGFGLAGRGDLLHQARGDLGVQLRLAGARAADGAGQIGGGDVLQQVARGAGLDRRAPRARRPGTRSG